jgi:uncharacterized protein (DUF2147 family)
MSGMLRTGIALASALMLSMGPAMAAQDLGLYQTTDRKMDFQLSTCGSGDKELCVTLTQARGDSATWQVTPYIGKLVVTRAKPAGKNVWRGTMIFGQYELTGKMTLKPGQSFKVSGCAYIVVCEDINLIPAQ